MGIISAVGTTVKVASADLNAAKQRRRTRIKDIERANIRFLHPRGNFNRKLYLRFVTVIRQKTAHPPLGSLIG